VLGSHLSGRDIGYPDWGLFTIFLSSSRQILETYLDKIDVFLPNVAGGGGWMGVCVEGLTEAEKVIWLQG
jgi:hypothetical protein